MTENEKEINEIEDENELGESIEEEIIIGANESPLINSKTKGKAQKLIPLPKKPKDS